MMSKKSNVSYEKYLEQSLDLISNNFTVKTYKLANKEEYPFFDRKKDCRIQIRWRGKGIYEFVVEKSFWYTSNTNKLDREYMRGWADIKIEMCKDAVVRGKKKYEAEKKKEKKNTKAKSRNSGVVEIGSTQKAFEKAKKNLRKK